MAPFIFDIICFTHKTFSVTESIILSVIFVVICQALLGIHRTPVNKQSRKNTAAELLAPSSSLPAGVRARYYRKLASFEPEFQPLLNYINPEPQVNKAPSTDIGKLCIDVISWLRAIAGFSPVISLFSLFGAFVKTKFPYTLAASCPIFLPFSPLLPFCQFQCQTSGSIIGFL